MKVSDVMDCMYRNKDKIIRINECKSDKSKAYNNNELFVLWEYFMRKIGAPKFCGCFDLTRKEYGYCVWKIFGKKSALNFMVDTKDSKSWKEVSTRRYALDIMETYKGRGQLFLRNIAKPETQMQKKYLDKYGDLNELGKNLLNTLTTQPV